MFSIVSSSRWWWWNVYLKVATMVVYCFEFAVSTKLYSYMWTIFLVLWYNTFVKNFLLEKHWLQWMKKITALTYVTNSVDFVQFLKFQRLKISVLNEHNTVLTSNELCFLAWQSVSSGSTLIAYVSNAAN